MTFWSGETSVRKLALFCPMLEVSLSLPILQGALARPHSCIAVAESHISCHCWRIHVPILAASQMWCVKRFGKCTTVSVAAETCGHLSAFESSKPPFLPTAVAAGLARLKNETRLSFPHIQASSGLTSRVSIGLPDSHSLW